MSTSRSPIEYALHHAGDFGNSIQTASIAHTPVDRFLMGQRRLNRGDSDPRDTPPQLNSIGNTQFVDFSFPLQNINSSSGTDEAIDAKTEHRSDIYYPSAEGSVSEHRSSIASAAAGRASFSSTGPLTQAQDGSVEGSDNASPKSNRARGGSIADGFADEFGLHRGAAGDGSDLGSKTKDEKDGPTPPWSELKTKAGKERKRLPLACIACRRKKIRCSGEKPACKHCLKSRIPCVYKVTTRKAAPRTDYMAMLDKRLKRMEERIIKIVPKEEHDPTAVARAQVKPGIPGSTPVRTVNSKKRMADEAFGSELESWAKSTSSENSDRGIPSSVLIQEAGENRLLREGSEAVPSQEIQEHLAEVFFENIYGQAYHLLHKPSFMRKLR
jgi:Fungal Zn(2)-Cys(6) binuclear cluster domain